MIIGSASCRSCQLCSTTSSSTSPIEWRSVSACAADSRGAGAIAFMSATDMRMRWKATCAAPRAPARWPPPPPPPPSSSSSSPPAALVGIELNLTDELRPMRWMVEARPTAATRLMRPRRGAAPPPSSAPSAWSSRARPDLREAPAEAPPRLLRLAGWRMDARPAVDARGAPPAGFRIERVDLACKPPTPARGVVRVESGDPGKAKPTAWPASCWASTDVSGGAPGDAAPGDSGAPGVAVAPAAAGEASASFCASLSWRASSCRWVQRTAREERTCDRLPNGRPISGQ